MIDILRRPGGVFEDLVGLNSPKCALCGTLRSPTVLTHESAYDQIVEYLYFNNGITAISPSILDDISTTMVKISRNSDPDLGNTSTRPRSQIVLARGITIRRLVRSNCTHQAKLSSISIKEPCCFTHLT